jgi:simple sugar transport system ATP-binding protein
VPEDGWAAARCRRWGLAHNLLLTRTDTGRQSGWIDVKALQAQAADIIRRFNVKAGGPATRRRSRCPGGNLQKFIVGREIDANPKLLIVSQPTWGVDVGARRRSAPRSWRCATRAAPCWW